MASPKEKNLSYKEAKKMSQELFPFVKMAAKERGVPIHHYVITAKLVKRIQSQLEHLKSVQDTV